MIQVQIKQVKVLGLDMYQLYYKGELIAQAWSIAGVKTQAIINLKKRNIK